MHCLINSKSINFAKNVFYATKCRKYFLDGRQSIFTMTSKFTSSQEIHREPSISMEEVNNKLIKIMGIERGYHPLLPSRAHLLELLPKKREDLPPRTMQDSFCSAIIPLSTDVILQDKYVTAFGGMRIGRLLEDMDLFAVWVAHKHILNPLVKPNEVSPYVIVTVLVDKINITDYIPQPRADVRISGHVSWVSKSTMEIVVWLEQQHSEKWQKITRALFLMAARDPTNSHSAMVNPIEPGNDEEKKILAGGEDRKKRRIAFQSLSLSKVIPNLEEQNIIHNLFVKTLNLSDPSFSNRILPGGHNWMETSYLSNLIFSQPEHRNLHNKVFGGFLMRNALELSWACVYLFSKYRPTLIHINDIAFHKPVEVTSLIRMVAHVVYTEAHFLQVVVYAEVYCPHTNNVTLTNAFHFTYQIPSDNCKVVPKLYQEAMMYIDGRRHLQSAMEGYQSTR